MFLNMIKLKLKNLLTDLNRKHEMFLNLLAQHLIKNDINLTVNMKCF